MKSSGGCIIQNYLIDCNSIFGIFRKKLQQTLQKAFERAFGLVFEKGTGVIEKTYRREEMEKNYQIREFAVSVKKEDYCIWKDRIVAGRLSERDTGEGDGRRAVHEPFIYEISAGVPAGGCCGRCL